jgi:hypothetical protein
MPLKGIEEQAANLLKERLIKSGYQAEWQPGDNPPDLVFEVNGLDQWAVEVTELRQYFDQNGEPNERTTIEQSLLRLCDKVRAEVSSELQRTYWLHANGPVVSPSPHIVGQRAIAYVRSGKTEEEVLDNHGRVRIKTFSSPPRFVGTVGLDQSVRGGDGESLIADIHANHQFSLNRILEEKLPSLACLTMYQRRVLLIWNSYYFGDPLAVREILAETTLPAEQLDSVFFVFENEVHLVANPGELSIQKTVSHAKVTRVV